jgi:hypothetical protein
MVISQEAISWEFDAETGSRESFIMETVFGHPIGPGHSRAQRSLLLRRGIAGLAFTVPSPPVESINQIASHSDVMAVWL